MRLQARFPFAPAARLAAPILSVALLASCGGGDSTSGLWAGEFSGNRQIAAVVHEDGGYYLLYSRPGQETLAGLIRGTITYHQGASFKAQGTDYNWEAPGRPLAVDLHAQLNPEWLALTGTVRSGPGAPRTLKASHLGYGDAALAPIVGKHTGTVVFALGPRPGTTFVVEPNGRVTTELNGCKIAGTVAARADGNGYDLSMTLGGYPCFAPYAPFKGVAFYREDERKLYAGVIFAPYQQAIGFIGTKQ